MPARDTLYLHEEIALLALHDVKGRVASGSYFIYAAGGALVAELLLQQRILIEDSKKKLVDVANPAPVGEPLLDECLGKIVEAKRRASVSTWVSRFATLRRLEHRIAEQLCRRGVLRAEEGKVLRIFNRTTYPEMDPQPERRLVERLRRAIFDEDARVAPRTAVLLSLAHSAELLKLVFDKKELKGRKARLEEIASGELTGKAAREAIEAMRAAVMVACLLPAMTAATSN